MRGQAMLQRKPGRTLRADNSPLRFRFRLPGAVINRAPRPSAGTRPQCAAGADRCLRCAQPTKGSITWAIRGSGRRALRSRGEERGYPGGCEGRAGASCQALPDPLTPLTLDPTQILATAATVYGVGGALSVLLQAREMRARGGSGGVSLRFLATYVGGYAIWLLYGISVQSAPIVLVHALGLMTGTVTLTVALKLRRPILSAGRRPQCA